MATFIIGNLGGSGGAGYIVGLHKTFKKENMIYITEDPHEIQLLRLMVNVREVTEPKTAPISDIPITPKIKTKGRDKQ